MSSENKMDVGEEARQNLSSPERESPQEGAAQGNMSGTTQSKSEAMRVREDMQNLKWKIYKDNFIQRYERAKQENDLENGGGSCGSGESASTSGGSNEDLDKYIELKMKLSEKLEELEKIRIVRVHKLINLVNEVKVVKEENDPKEYVPWKELKVTQKQSGELENEVE